MTDAPLRADNLVVERGGIRILDDVSLPVPDGARLLVRGPSGAGKTTLFQQLGLLDTPDAGSVTVAGTDAAALSDRRRATLRGEHLGFVFQDFQLVGDLTARENAALPQEIRGERDDAWLDELFETLLLEDRADAYPPALSGGEKQRVAIARALANRPRVVLADEPTGQLDPDTAGQVIDLLVRTQREAGAALVIISHDPVLADAVDTTYRLADGRLSAE